MRLKSKDIVALVSAVRDAGYRQFRVQEEGFLFELEAPGAVTTPHDAAPGPGTEAPVPPAADDSPVVAEREGLVPILAPMTGTFYRSSAPGEPPFVEVGDSVEATDTVCIIEVMKLFSSIAAGVAGEIAEISVSNEGAVISGEPCIWIRPRAQE